MSLHGVKRYVNHYLLDRIMDLLIPNSSPGPLAYVCFQLSGGAHAYAERPDLEQGIALLKYVAAGIVSVTTNVAKPRLLRLPVVA